MAGLGRLRLKVSVFGPGKPPESCRSRLPGLNRLRKNGFRMREKQLQILPLRRAQRQDDIGGLGSVVSRPATTPGSLETPRTASRETGATTTPRRSAALLALFGFFDCRGHGKQIIEPGELEELENARPDACQHQPDASALAAGKLADQHAQTGGIDVGHFGEVENVQRLLLLLLRVKQVAQRNRRERGVHVSRGKGTCETKNHGAGRSTRRLHECEIGTSPQ